MRRIRLQHCNTFRVDAFVGLCCGYDCFGWADIVCDAKASPMTTYMKKAVHMPASDDVFGGV